MKKFEIKKVLSTALVLAFTTQSALAVQNYTVTTTTSENYAASSPVGQFNNYSTNGVSYVATVPMYNYNYNNGYNGYNYYYQPVQNTQYYNPTYSGGVTYRTTNPDYNQNYTGQSINTPQQYNKTVSTTQQYVDTRETADKVIDRGVKVVGTLAVVGAVTGILINAFK